MLARIQSFLFAFVGWIAITIIFGLAFSPVVAGILLQIKHISK